MQHINSDKHSRILRSNRYNDFILEMAENMNKQKQIEASLSHCFESTNALDESE